MSSKTQSILSYLGFFWMIAFLFGTNGDRFSIYHLRQGFGLTIIFCPLAFIVFFFEFLFSKTEPLSIIFLLPFIILSGVGIIHVINQVERPLPLIGKIFEKQFKFIK